MSHWNRKTILIVLSQTTFMLETNSQWGMLGFPEPWKCVFGNSILSLFNLLFYIFPLDYKAFKEKCCSADKQMIKIFRKNKCLLSVWKTNTGAISSKAIIWMIGNKISWQQTHWQRQTDHSARYTNGKFSVKTRWDIEGDCLFYSK